MSETDATPSKYMTILRDEAGQILGALITADKDVYKVSAETTKALIKDGRFYGRCKCSPHISAINHFTGFDVPDDCAVHG